MDDVDLQIERLDEVSRAGKGSLKKKKMEASTPSSMSSLNEVENLVKLITQSHIMPVNFSISQPLANGSYACIQDRQYSINVF